MESKLGHNFPVKSARNPLVNRLNGVKVFRLPLKKAMPHGKFSSLKINNQIKKRKYINDGKICTGSYYFALG